MDQINLKLSQAITAQKESLAATLIDQQWQLYPELTARYGEVGRAKCLQDVQYNLTYLAQAIAVASPALFADYIAWVKVLFAGLKIPTEDLVHSLELMSGVLQQHFSAEEGAIAAAYIEAGLKRLPQLPSTLPSFIKAGQPLNNLAQQYLTALLQGERRLASRLILGAVESGTPVKEIYLYVFQTAQREIGRLWQMNQVSVAQEHYCTAATQLIMSQLYPHIFTTERNERTLVATCVGGELHEIGVRIIADFFEMEGWDTFYLGANTPAPSILQTLTSRQADVLGISATMAFHLQTVADLIAAVRASEAGQRVKILVGSYPFNIAPDLWRQIGADASAPDADAALSAAKQLIFN
jgi:MerR family transcriptional regulator, light-induced transcriptional regulator